MRSFGDEYVEMLEAVADGALLPAWVDDEDAVRWSARRILDDFPAANRRRGPTVVARGTMPGRDPGRTGDEHPEGRETMGWRDDLLRSVEDAADRVVNLERELTEAGVVDLDDDARSREGGSGADLAQLRRSFAPLAPSGDRAENVGDGDAVEVRAIMSGPRGEAAIDDDDARDEARGRRRAAENRDRREERRRRGEVGVEVQNIMSGPRGEAAIDED